MYKCTECHWLGTELAYNYNGQGKCPKCGKVFIGCISQEKWEQPKMEKEKQNE